MDALRRAALDLAVVLSALKGRLSAMHLGERM
jgi:hypothetical protein